MRVQKLQLLRWRAKVYLRTFLTPSYLFLCLRRPPALCTVFITWNKVKNKFLYLFIQPTPIPFARSHKHLKSPSVFCLRPGLKDTSLLIGLTLQGLVSFWATGQQRSKHKRRIILQPIFWQWKILKKLKKLNLKVIKLENVRNDRDFDDSHFPAPSCFNEDTEAPWGDMICSKPHREKENDYHMQQGKCISKTLRWVEWKKPDRKECILYYIPLSSGAENKLWGQKSVFGWVGECETKRDPRELLVVMKIIFCTLIGLLVTWWTQVSKPIPLYPLNLFILCVNWVSTDWFNFCRCCCCCCYY